jgi:hypothetical protein
MPTKEGTLRPRGSPPRAALGGQRSGCRASRLNAAAAELGAEAPEAATSGLAWDRLSQRLDWYESKTHHELAGVGRLLELVCRSPIDDRHVRPGSHRTRKTDADACLPHER